MPQELRDRRMSGTNAYGQVVTVQQSPRGLQSPCGALGEAEQAFLDQNGLWGDDNMSVRSFAADAITGQVPLWLQDLRRVVPRLNHWLTEWDADALQIEKSMPQILHANVEAARQGEREAAAVESKATAKLSDALSVISGMVDTSQPPGRVGRGVRSEAGGKSVRSANSRALSQAAASLAGTQKTAATFQSLTGSASGGEAVGAAALRSLVGVVGLRFASAKENKRIAELKSGLSLVLREGARLAEALRQTKKREDELASREALVAEMAASVRNIQSVAAAGRRKLKDEGGSEVAEVSLEEATALLEDAVQAKAEVVAVQSRLGEVLCELEEKSELLGEAENEVASLKTSLTRLEETLASERVTLSHQGSAEVRSLVEKVNEYATKLAGLSSSNENLQVMLDAAVLRADTSSEAAATLQQKLDDLVLQCQQTSQEASLETRRAQDLALELSAVNEKLSASSCALVDKQSRIESLEVQLVQGDSAHRSQMTVLQSRIADLQGKLLPLHEMHEQELAHMKEQLLSRENDARATADASIELDSLLIETQARVAALDAEVATLSTQKEAMREALESEGKSRAAAELRLTEVLIKVDSELSGLEVAKRNLESEASALQADVARLENSLEQVRGVLEKLHPEAVESSDVEILLERHAAYIQRLRSELELRGSADDARIEFLEAEVRSVEDCLTRAGHLLQGSSSERLEAFLQQIEQEREEHRSLLELAKGRAIELEAAFSNTQVQAATLQSECEDLRDQMQLAIVERAQLLEANESLKREHPSGQSSEIQRSQENMREAQADAQAKGAALKEAQAGLMQAREFVVSAQAKIRQLEDSKKQTEAITSDLRFRLEATQLELIEANDALDKAKATIEASAELREQTVSALTTQLKETAALLEETNLQLELSKDHLRSSGQLQLVSEKEHSETIASLNRELMLAAGRIQELETSLAAFAEREEATMDAATQQAEEAAAQLSASRSSLAEAMANLESKTRELAAAHSTVESLNDQLADATLQVESMARTAQNSADLLDQIASLTSQLKEKGDATLRLEGDVRNLTLQQDAMTRELDAMETQMEESQRARDENDQWRIRAGELQEEMALARMQLQELGELKSQALSASHETASLAAQVRFLETTRQTLVNASDSSKQQLASLETRLLEATAAKDAAEMALQDSNIRIVSLEARISSLSDELDQQKSKSSVPSNGALEEMLATLKDRQAAMMKSWTADLHSTQSTLQSAVDRRKKRLQERGFKARASRRKSVVLPIPSAASADPSRAAEYPPKGRKSRLGPNGRHSLWRVSVLSLAAQEARHFAEDDEEDSVDWMHLGSPSEDLTAPLAADLPSVSGAIGRDTDVAGEFSLARLMGGEGPSVLNTPPPRKSVARKSVRLAHSPSKPHLSLMLAPVPAVDVPPAPSPELPGDRELQALASMRRGSPRGLLVPPRPSPVRMLETPNRQSSSPEDLVDLVAGGALSPERLPSKNLQDEVDALQKEVKQLAADLTEEQRRSLASRDQEEVLAAERARATEEKSRLEQQLLEAQAAAAVQRGRIGFLQSEVDSLRQDLRAAERRSKKKEDGDPKRASSSVASALNQLLAELPVQASASQGAAASEATMTPLQRRASLLAGLLPASPASKKRQEARGELEAAESPAKAPGASKVYR